MGRGFQTSPRSVLNFKNGRDSLGEVFTIDAFGGVKRIYSNDRPCDCEASLLLSARRPIVAGPGNDPTPARKIVAIGGNPFWLNKTSQDDTYTLCALTHCDPTRVRMYLFNP